VAAAEVKPRQKGSVVVAAISEEAVAKTLNVSVDRGYRTDVNVPPRACYDSTVTAPAFKPNLFVASMQHVDDWLS